MPKNPEISVNNTDYKKSQFEHVLLDGSVISTTKRVIFGI